MKRVEIEKKDQFRMILGGNAAIRMKTGMNGRMGTGMFSCHRMKWGEIEKKEKTNLG